MSSKPLLWKTSAILRLPTATLNDILARFQTRSPQRGNQILRITSKIWKNIFGGISFFVHFSNIATQAFPCKKFSNAIFPNNYLPKTAFAWFSRLFLSTSKWSNSSSPMGPISLIGFIQMRKKKTTSVKFHEFGTKLFTKIQRFLFTPVRSQFIYPAMYPGASTYWIVNQIYHNWSPGQQPQNAFKIYIWQNVPWIAFSKCPNATDHMG